jgi:hypothetical protein
MKALATVALVVALTGSGVAGPVPLAIGAEPARAAESFRFEAEVGYDEMKTLVTRQFSTATTRAQVRALFVEQGGATLIIHPRKPNVEKYIYDINLCNYYVWRWNISADYGLGGKLEQIYINGAPQLGGAPQPELPKKGPFFELTRPRPEAYKGEKYLKAIVSGQNGDTKTYQDMVILTGIVPMRADPLDMGKAVNERGEVWRSSFDLDDARFIAPYPGDCAAVDAKLASKH